MVFRSHVRNPEKALLRLRHVGDSRITLKNFVSCNNPLFSSRGIWNRIVEDLNR